MDKPNYWDCWEPNPNATPPVTRTGRSYRRIPEVHHKEWCGCPNQLTHTN